MRSLLISLLLASAPSPALDLLLLDDGDSNADLLALVLEGHGHTVTRSADDLDFYEYDFDGTASTADLWDYDAVLWLDGANATSYEMESSGRSVLLDWVEGGGGLLVFGATGYAREAYEYYSGIGSLMPIRSSSYLSRNQTFVCEVADHPVAQGFTAGETTSLKTGIITDSTASAGTTVFGVDRTGSEATYAGIVATELSAGRTVQYAWWGNTTSSYSSYETDWDDGDLPTLLENGLQWAVLRPPVVNLPSGLLVDAGSSITLVPTAAYDPDGGAVSLVWDIGADGGSSGTGSSLVFDASGYDGPDTEEISLRATDDEGEETTTTTSVGIRNVAPVIAAAPSTEPQLEGDEVSFSLDFSDVEAGDSHVVSWEFGDGSTGTGATVSHAWADNDRYTVSVTVTDDDGAGDLISFSQTIRNVAPELSGSPETTAIEGSLWTFTPIVTDPGADSFSFAASCPPGCALDEATGELRWTPTAADLGEHEIELTVTDDDLDSGSMSFTLTVVLLDADGDGMGDSWELEHGLDPEDPLDAALDGDGDGRDNLAEYDNGWDPTLYEGPGAPTLLSPIGGDEVHDTMPELDAGNADKPLGQVLSYAYRVYGDADLATLVDSVDGRLEEGDGVTSWQVGRALVENGEYWWTAQASDAYITGPSAPAEAFFVNAVDEPPPAPVLASPFDGAVVASLLPELVLLASHDPDRDSVSYEAELLDPEGTVLQSVSGLRDDGSLASWPLAEALLEDHGYCWRARALDEDALYSPDSALACFFVDLENAAPSAPSILSPTEGQLLTTLRPTVELANGVDPEGRTTVHELQLDRSTSFGSADLVQVQVATQADGTTDWTPVVDLAGGGTWYLRARCSDGGAQSGWVQSSFEISTGDLPPSVPELLSPLGETELEGAVTFQVGGSADPEGSSVSYELMVVDRMGGTVATVSGLAADETAVATWFGPALDDGRYTWTARALDPAGGASAWADPWTFAIVGGQGSGDGGAGDSGDADGLTILGEGCTCSQGAGAPRPLAAVLVSVLMLCGLVRRRRE